MASLRDMEAPIAKAVGAFLLGLMRIIIALLPETNLTRSFARLAAF
jgi:hypothetical protein